VVRSAESATSLGQRLALVTVAFCMLFAVLTVAVRTWSAWQAHVEVMNGELALLDQVYQRTLSKAIWEMDRELLHTHVVSAARVAAVGKVELRITPANGAPEVLVQTRPGWLPSELAPARHLTLSYEPFPGGAETVGELALYGDERVLWSRLRGEVAAIAITQLIQCVLLAGLIMLMFSRLVTVHVQRIARHLAQLTPATLGQPLVLDRSSAHRDELTLLVGGVNQLQGSLSDYLQKQHVQELELAQHRDRLAGLVEERTAELQVLNGQLEQLSRSDALTGLFNRRHFDEVKEQEFRRAQRSGEPLSVLLCDIDFFKRYNDTYGHALGDQCLRTVAEAMRASTARAGDLLARIGGEEFAVLLPGTDEPTARVLAEKLRDSVAALAVAHATSEVAPHVTLSIGVACLRAGNAPTFDALLHLADRALYRAKGRGRNRVSSLETNAGSLMETHP
jgi:diguanylate cyclase (GGDEF)-like protein